jgi:hypothetical protein
MQLPLTILAVLLSFLQLASPLALFSRLPRFAITNTASTRLHLSTSDFKNGMTFEVGEYNNCVLTLLHLMWFSMDRRVASATTRVSAREARTGLCFRPNENKESSYRLCGGTNFPLW